MVILATVDRTEQITFYCIHLEIFTFYEVKLEGVLTIPRSHQNPAPWLYAYF